MAASFYSSPLIGATTTLACFAHEIPHEIADYSILIRSGFTKKQAMQSQFLTAIGAFVRAFPPSSSLPPSLPSSSLHSPDLCRVHAHRGRCGWTDADFYFLDIVSRPGMSCHGTAHTGRVR